MSQLKTLRLKNRLILFSVSFWTSCLCCMPVELNRLFAQSGAPTKSQVTDQSTASTPNSGNATEVDDGSESASDDGAASTKQLPWPPVPLLNEAWDALPASDLGKGTPLPKWARIISRTLPYTTAAMIELEFIYRTEPLVIVPVSDDTESTEARHTALDGNVLASVARYSVAEFHHSNYGKRYAVSDLVRRKHADIADTLVTAPDKLPPLALEVYQFANQMASMGSNLTDENYQSLRKQVGDDAMVGLVLRIAHGCFQDRMLCALGIANESDANDIPIEVHFIDSLPNGSNTPSASRDDDPQMVASVEADKALSGSVGQRDSKKLGKVAADTVNAGWGDMDSDALQRRLSQQRERSPRIAVPEWDSIAAKIPKDLYRRPLRIRWSRVVVGYQPKLGPAWIKCLRVFEQEAHQNRVFEESVFWVVTRGLKCFYCMGHCEMLMEVGGLKRDGILDRTTRLASGDWSSFSEVEQTAFQFAKKLTATPLDMNNADLEAIHEKLGDVRALDLLWWSSRCQFMTKVSDAFQLQLENDNVFAD